MFAESVKQFAEHKIISIRLADFSHKLLVSRSMRISEEVGQRPHHKSHAVTETHTQSGCHGAPTIE